MTENIVGSSGDQEVATSEARTPASEPSRLNSDGVESTQADESAVIDATLHQLSGCGEGMQIMFLTQKKNRPILA